METGEGNQEQNLGHPRVFSPLGSSPSGAYRSSLAALTQS